MFSIEITLQDQNRYFQRLNIFKKDIQQQDEPNKSAASEVCTMVSPQDKGWKRVPPQGYIGVKPSLANFGDKRLLRGLEPVTS